MEFIIDCIKMFDYRKLILPVMLVLLFIVGFIYLNNRIDDEKIISVNDSLIKNEELDVVTISDDFIDEFIYVDIKGAVKNPGVYKLKDNSRVIDAINIAGGLIKNSNTVYMNLSKILKDTDVVKVYTNSEVEEAFKEEKIEIVEPCICEEVICDLNTNEDVENSDDKEESVKININSASILQLDSLNGIGEAKAKAILEYRNTNGNFIKIEDIMNVPGISESLFEKIKDFITV